MDTMDMYEIVMKLIGPIHPEGECNEDDKRLKNLKALTTLVDKLLFEIGYAACYADRREASMRAIGIFAHDFLATIGVREDIY